MDGLDFRILGPFEVRRDGHVIAAGGGRRHAVLAALLVSPNVPVSVARLRQLVWGDREPSSAANLIQGYVSDWRSRLDPDRGRRDSGARLLSTAAGYELRVDPEECDRSRFSARAERARAATTANDLAAASPLWDEAVAMRRGVTLNEFAHFDAVRTAIEDEWLSALLGAADVALRTGRADHAMALLEGPLAEHPLREDMVAAGLRALYQLGRQSDALTLFQRTRVALAQELGVDPSPALSRLHVQILRHDPTLDRVAREPTGRVRLPASLSTFVGREDDIAAVTAMLGEHRLVTLTGPGGTGKTRLGVEVARARTGSTDGVVAFVDAAALDGVSLLWPAIATALGQQLVATPEPVDALAAQLGGRPWTLVLDNMEHLPAAAPGVARLLAQTDAVRVLATSRTALGVPGERLYHVAPLPLPEPTAGTVTEVLAAASARMFVDRAREADPTFTLDPSDALVLAGVCRRLDGLPLALELAAAWTRTLSLAGLLERLDRPLDLLVADPHTARPRRHRTMRDVIEWSYAAVDDRSRALLDQLSVFESGARLDALAATTALGPALVPALGALVEANLVVRVGSGEAGRYRLLQTVRDYALERGADRAPARAAARTRHARWCRDLAEQAARGARSGAGAELTNRLGEEQSEIRAALAHLRETGDAVAVLELTVDCLALWWDLGHIDEGYARVTSALEHVSPDTDPALLAAAHIVATYVGEAAGRTDEVVAHDRAAIEHARRAGRPVLELMARSCLGNTLSWSDWDGPAQVGLGLLRSVTDAVAATAADEHRWGWSNRRTVDNLARMSTIDVLRYRDSAQARALAVVVRADAERVDDAHHAAFAVRAYGFLQSDCGQFDLAEDALAESLRLAVRSGSARNESRTLDELARLAWSRGDLDRAADLASTATRLSRDLGHALNWIRCAALLVDVRAAQGQLDAGRAQLDDVERVVRLVHPKRADRTLRPRRARLARLAGDLPRADHYLADAHPIGLDGPLMPERVVLLVELALAASSRGDEDGARGLADGLFRAAERVGIVLPGPEAHYLASVGRTSPEAFQSHLAR